MLSDFPKSPLWEVKEPGQYSYHFTIKTLWDTMASILQSKIFNNREVNWLFQSSERESKDSDVCLTDFPALPGLIF